EAGVVTQPLAEPVAPVPVPQTAASPPTSDLQEPTQEQTAVIADLHWLIHQGHVIEFANGRIETAKKPIPKPPRPAPKPAASQIAAAAVADKTSGAASVEPDVVSTGNGAEIAEQAAAPQNAG